MKLQGVRFKRTPAPATELLIEQLEGALQIIAVLVLTDEEVLEVAIARDPELREENLGGWAQGMKEDLLSEEGREELVAMLRHQSFPCNTDRQFPLSRLSEAPAVNLDVLKAYEKLERMAVAYAKGVGEEVPWRDDAACKAHWIQRLVKKGVSEETATWIMRTEGALVTSMAQLQRLRRPNATTP